MKLDTVYVLPVAAGQIWSDTPPDGTRGYVRLPRNSNSVEPVDDLQSQYSSFCKIHSPVPSRRPSLIRSWCFVYGTIDIQSRKPHPPTAANTGVSEAPVRSWVS